MQEVESRQFQLNRGQFQSRVDIAYDESTYSNATCITSAPQHDDTNYGCSYVTRGNPTTITSYTDANTPGGAITRHRYYDSLGNLVKADLSCCQQEQWTYSAATNYAFPDSTVRGPAGTQLTTSATYNAYTGQLATLTDENGKVTTYTYGDLGHLNRLTDLQRPDGQHVTYAYDDTARTVTVTLPLDSSNSVKQVSYSDGLGRPIKQQTKDGAGTSFSIMETQYDSWGRGYRVSNPHNSTAQYWTETRFDALGRPTLVIPPDGSPTSNNTSYSYALNAVTVTDPAGKQRKSQTDALGRLTKVFEPDVANGNALTQETDYTYSVLDGLLTVLQGPQTRTYSYDDLGRLLTAKTPETSQAAVSYQYDSSNNLIQRTDPRGVTTTYSYDGLNRLYQTSYNVGTTGVPATPTVTLTYGTNSANNTNGRLLTVNDGAGSETYSYDVMGQVTQLQKVSGATTYTIGYGYNYAGAITAVTYPSGRVVQQSFDSVGRIATLSSGGTNYVSGFTYNPAGEVTAFNYANGVAAVYTYTPERQLLNTLSYTKGTSTLLSLSYGYSAPNGGNNGQITTITDNVDSGRSVAYTFDALHRLSTATTTGSAGYPKWGLSWTYDRYGNRLTQSISSGCAAPMTCPTNAVSVNGTTNRIADSGYGYDANGNMTQDGANTLTFDAENRAVIAAGTSYVYDGNGLRVKRCVPNCTSPATQTLYIFAGSKVIAEYDNGAGVSAPSREYIYSGSTLVAKIESGTTSYYQADHLSNRVLTDANGNVVAQLGHHPYGEDWYQTTHKWKFTSYERDAESGNDYAIFRYYSNRIGRFMQPDKLAGAAPAPQSLNLYSYVRNDPVNLVDPSGLLTAIPVFFPQYYCRTVGYFYGFQENNDLPLQFCQYVYNIRGFILAPDDDRISKAKAAVKKILKGDNDCAKFFNTAQLPPSPSDDHDIGGAVRQTLTDAEKAFAYTRVEVDDNPDEIRKLDEGSVSAFSKYGQLSFGIILNPHGAFFNETGPNGGKFNVRGHAGNTLGAQLFILLHEFGHELKLLPRDDPKSDPQGTVQASNNALIEEKCKKAIEAAIAEALQGKAQ